nr:KRAB-A domain-containing protein 2-like [Onthophagus taurus]
MRSAINVTDCVPFKNQNAETEFKSKFMENIEEVVAARKASNKSTLQYRRLKRYDQLRLSDKKKLILPVSDQIADVKSFVTNDDLFDVIHNAHRECGHGGRDRMIKALGNKYVKFNQMSKICQVCQEKRNQPKKGLRLFKELDSRGQVDLINM